MHITSIFGVYLAILCGRIDEKMHNCLIVNSFLQNDHILRA
jgi:hypothetical protein